MKNLIKLHTYNGMLWVESGELSRYGNISTHLLHIYNRLGNRVVDSAAYLAATSNTHPYPHPFVHPNNLFASTKLAQQHRNEIYAKIFNRSTLDVSGTCP